jgi:dsRNA-specific ribonuclease
VLEFLGDAVLKMLSSIEIFVAFPLANENILHVERARIVSNENLRRASVINRFFHYI